MKGRRVFLFLSFFLFKNESWDYKSLVCCVVLLILCCSVYLYFTFSPTSCFIIVWTNMACTNCVCLWDNTVPIPPHPPMGMETVGHLGGPPVQADYRGSHLYLRRLLPRLLVARKEKQRLQGNRTPQASVASLQLRWMEFTVCGSRPIHGCSSSPQPGCHSTPWGLLVSFDGSLVVKVLLRDVELKKQNGRRSLGSSLSQGAGTLHWWAADTSLL